ncbi:hypothetical protein SMAC4_13241 [Sordaria macrospora]|uniref:uncharacterized protein n=1 Tax=Sordaria macrospora TaxID=5147 RepID=UPI002B325707|nr:hypothetical protein SMAC4_13241 [Sordaria macrospora]
MRDQKSVKWACILRTVKPVADHWEAVTSADFGNGSSCNKTAKQEAARNNRRLGPEWDTLHGTSMHSLKLKGWTVP